MLCSEPSDQATRERDHWDKTKRKRDVNIASFPMHSLLKPCYHWPCFIVFKGRGGSFLGLFECLDGFLDV